MAKKIHKNSMTGQSGINLIEKIVLDMGFVWRATDVMDAGIDGTIEIRNPDTGAMTNNILQVQSKAKDAQFTAETQPEERLWLQSGRLPVGHGIIS
jgi:hypothetical protein